MFSKSFFSNVAATVVGGILLAVILFLAHEKFFPLPNIMGQWYFQIHTTESEHIPYNNMTLEYVAVLWQQGNRVQGTAEKIYEDSSSGKIEYTGQHRTQSRINGYIKKNYFGSDRAYLHMAEEGKRRESTTFYEVTVDSNQKMKGTFNSTIAHQSGNTRWQRERFPK